MVRSLPICSGFKASPPGMSFNPRFFARPKPSFGLCIHNKSKWLCRERPLTMSCGMRGCPAGTERLRKRPLRLPSLLHAAGGSSSRVPWNTISSAFSNIQAGIVSQTKFYPTGSYSETDSVLACLPCAFYHKLVKSATFFSLCASCSLAKPLHFSY